jgi:hypothetical protein
MVDQKTLSDARTTIDEIERVDSWAHCKTHPTTHLYKAHASARRVLAALQGGPIPAPIDELHTLWHYPTDAMHELYRSDFGLVPVILPGGVIEHAATAIPGVSRSFWEGLLGLGSAFSISCSVAYTADFYGTAMRLEDYHSDSNNKHRLELDRWRSDGFWRVVRNRNQSRDGVSDEDTEIVGSFEMPVTLDETKTLFTHVEIRGIISPIDGKALTILLVDGKEVGRNEKVRNWPDALNTNGFERWRYGIVAGNQKRDCKVWTKDMEARAGS